MALVEGVKYGLSSQVDQSGKKSKTVIFVKLTDSALRAIDEYLKIQQKTGPGQRASLRFQGNEGNIFIPSSTNENGHSFSFGLSTNSDIEGPQGSFECIQQCGPRSLESAGPLSYKMRIKANDDVFVQTQNRFNELEQERKQECAKEIKQSCPDIGRKVKKKIGLPPLPQRREKSPSYISQQSKHPSAPNFANSSSNSQKLPNGYNNSSLSSNSAININNRKVVNGSSNGNIAPGSATGSKNGVNSGSQDISKRPIKERLIHMLAVKPYKKPELYQRLQSDGIKDRDRKIFMTILQQIANFKDNEYSLHRGIWNDVQEDWPFYSEQERQLMKRRKPQNLTPPGSDSSVGSGTSSLSPRSNSSIGSGHSPSNYSHSLAYPKITISGSSDANYKNVSTFEGGFEGSKGTKRAVSNGILTDSAEDYGDIPHKKTRVSHFKRPGSGGSSSINGANPNHHSRLELAIKPEKDAFHGSSPQYSSQNNRIAERLSPIGTSGSTNFSVQNGSNGSGQMITNHRSPRNGNYEPMDVSPSHGYGVSNGYHSSSQGEANLEESVTVGSSWQSRNGVHDPHSLSDSEKPSRGDSDETDSIDSGNGSSSSAGSVGGHHNHSNNVNSANNNRPDRPIGKTHGGYSNGLTNKPIVVKSESTSSSDHNSVKNTLNLTNGCNRVSSTTSFHSTPQSSPDSQIDTLQLQQQKCQSINNTSVMPSKHNQRSNGKCNFEVNANVDIVVTRDKGVDKDSYKDSYKDRDRRRTEKEKDRDSRNRDRSKRNSDKRYPRILENGDEHGMDKNGDAHPVKIASEYPSYLTRYTTISSVEQRGKYKEDFNTEYPEYRKLHAVIDKVSKKFAHLEERLRQEERGTEGYEKIKEMIVNEYYANKRDKKYQETRQKFQYLHEKLSHIKRLVADYDAQHSQDQDVSNEYANGFLRNSTT